MVATHRHVSAPGRADPQAGAVATKAALRAAERLKLPGRALAATLGLSDASVSRMRRGGYVLSPGEKPFELALMLVRLYRGLDAITGGDDATSAAWIVADNRALGARPVDLMQSVSGLVDVIAYLDARRALV